VAGGIFVMVTVTGDHPQAAGILGSIVCRWQCRRGRRVGPRCDVESRRSEAPARPGPGRRRLPRRPLPSKDSPPRTILRTSSQFTSCDYDGRSARPAPGWREQRPCRL